MKKNDDAKDEGLKIASTPAPMKVDNSGQQKVD